MSRKIKTLLLILAALMTLAALVSCSIGGISLGGGNDKGDKEDHEHDFGEWEIVTEPTCAEEGEQIRTCKCGEEETEKIPATGNHKYKGWIVTKEPTCNELGKKENSCACGKTLSSTVPKTTDHTYDDVGLCILCRATMPYTDGLRFVFSEDGEGWKVDLYGGNDKEVVIPPYYEGKPVVAIDNDAFNGCIEVVSISIPHTVTVIMDNAFVGCGGLVGITLPDALEYIGVGAFSYCTSLAEIVIPTSVTTIDRLAFYGCTALVRVEFLGEVPELGENAFDDCPSLEVAPHKHIYGEWQTTLEPTCKSEGERSATCTECSSVKTESISKNPHSFNEWNNGSTPDCVNNGYLPHYYCTSCFGYFDESGEPIEDALIPALGHEFGEWIEEVPAGCEIGGTLGHYVCESCGFDYDEDENRLWSLYIPEKGHSYVDLECEGCNSVLSPSEGLEMRFSEEGQYWYVRSIGTCTDEDIVIPNEIDGYPVRTILMGAFENCTNIKSVLIPENITLIQVEAFEGCTNIETIYFNAVDLQSLTWSENVSSSIFQGVGKNTDGVSVIIGKNVTKIPDHLFRCYTNTIKIGEVKFAEGTVCEYIGDYAFYRMTYLLNFTIPDSVKTIGASAFAGCEELRTVTIPDSVTTVGSYAFGACEALDNVVVGKGITALPNGMFAGCNLINGITFRADLTAIGDYALSATNIMRFTVTENITKIGKGAFDDCDYLNISFENTVGWQMAKKADATTGMKLTETHFAEYWTINQYITETYSAYYWFRVAE